jgi:hypothetical protein
VSSWILRGLPRVLVLDRCTTVLADSLRIGVSAMREHMALSDLLTAVFAPPSEEPPSENPLLHRSSENSPSGNCLMNSWRGLDRVFL